MNKKEKVDNFTNMLTDYHNMLKELEDSKLKKQFKRFIYGMTSNNIPFKSMLMSIESMMSDPEQDRVYSSKFIINFWKKVQKILVDTYTENSK